MRQVEPQGRPRGLVPVQELGEGVEDGAEEADEAGEQADDDGGVRGAAPGVDLREDGQRLVQPPRLARALRGDGLDVVQSSPGTSKAQSCSTENVHGAVR